MPAIKIKFKPGKDVIITEQWITNNHWMVRKEFAKTLKEFKALNDLMPGDYRYGGRVDLNRSVESMVDTRLSEDVLNACTKPLVALNRALLSDYGIIESVVYRVGYKRVLIDVEYSALIGLGDAAYSDGNPRNPIIVKRGEEVIAMVMPRRK